MPAVMSSELSPLPTTKYAAAGKNVFGTVKADGNQPFDIRKGGSSERLDVKQKQGMPNTPFWLTEYQREGLRP